MKPQTNSQQQFSNNSISIYNPNVQNGLELSANFASSSSSL
ncbi:unnamed protein product [Brassica oleracea]|uniref:Uncharacterized protein n=1 Tax=Brassica oleracea TaxID=3712 RepID=A0A3P6DHP6_BRAOL|nr:unnamed protein product [Brassica oleracea]